MPYEKVVNKQIKLTCFLLGLLVVAIIPAEGLLIKSAGYELYTMLKSIFWMAIIIVILIVFPKTSQNGKLKYSPHFKLWALNCGLIYIGISILTGVMLGIGKSPYDHSMTGIVFNILTVGSALVATEFIRSYLVNGIVSREKYLAFLLIAFLMALPQLKLSTAMQISDWIKFSMWICEDLGPKLFQSLLATYLCFLGGRIPAIIYMSIVTGFHWLSPVLPDIPWIVSGLIGIMVPVFQMIYISGSYMRLNKAIKEYKTPKENFIGWIVTYMLTIMLLWFVIGVFPIFPSVIATGSMEPVIYPGDVIMVNKITKIEEIKALEVGDIIQFRKDDMMICHRIIKIIDDEGVLYFVTKGDNNPAADRMPVKVEDIRGTIVKVIPKVGWPSLIFKLAGNQTTDPMQF